MGQELDPGGSDAMVTDVALAAQQVHRELGLEALDSIIKVAQATPQVHLSHDQLTLQPIPPKGESTVRQDSHANLMIDPARADLNPKTATDPLLSEYRFIHSAFVRLLMGLCRTPGSSGDIYQWWLVRGISCG